MADIAHDAIELGSDNHELAERTGKVLAHIFLAGLLALYLSCYIPHFFFR